uniref:Transmembrane protein n=1 Tax=Arundo donax TaxID=35708 RepID=A0A0A9BH27_ARUDO
MGDVFHPTNGEPLLQSFTHMTRFFILIFLLCSLSCFHLFASSPSHHHAEASAAPCPLSSAPVEDTILPKSHLLNEKSVDKVWMLVVPRARRG